MRSSDAAPLDAQTDAGAPTILSRIDPLAHVAEELRPGASLLLADTTLSTLSDATIAGLRANETPLPLLPDVPVRRQRIEVRPGWDVAVEIVNAQPGASRPAILHTHGGGHVLSSARASVSRLQSLALALDCAIVSVDYQLAPEARFPVSAEENYAGLKWLHDQASELGVDRARIAVMGESAGGCHAALLALTARDRGEVPLVLQSLTYPMLDDRTGSTRRAPPHIGQILWGETQNRYGWRAFLGAEPGSAEVDPAGVPARRIDLSGLPPAWIGVGGIDLFVGENLDYSRRLLEAGVPTELVVVPGAYHGFEIVAADTPTAQRFSAARLDALRRAFRLPS